MTRILENDGPERYFRDCPVGPFIHFKLPGVMMFLTDEGEVIDECGAVHYVGPCERVQPLIMRIQ